MKFWDTSAIVLLLVEHQDVSKTARDLYRGDSELLVWQFTHAEAVSALTLLGRAHPPLPEARLQAALGRLDKLAKRWLEVRANTDERIDAFSRKVRNLLLADRDLRTGDALQLAAALTGFDPPLRRGFVTVDRVLARAARREGFTVFGTKAIT